MQFFPFTGELRFGTDESTFNAILVQRNVPQLQQIFAEYQNITGHPIETAIENEFSGDIKKGLLAIGTILRIYINRQLFLRESYLGARFFIHSQVCEEPAGLFRGTTLQEHERSWNRRSSLDPTSRDSLGDRHGRNKASFHERVWPELGKLHIGRKNNIFF